MNFQDCVTSAQKQGEISEEQAQALIDRWEEHRSARSRAGEADPDGAAKAALAAEYDEKAAQKQRTVALATENHAELTSYLKNHRDLKGNPDVFDATLNLFDSHGAGAGVVSITGRALGWISLAQNQMTDLMSSVRRSRLTGQRFNKPLVDDVAREVLGESTASAEAKGIGASVANVLEMLREKINELGGTIGKLDRYLPQVHNPTALLRAGFDTWRDFIKPRLDLDRMQDPLTGGRLTDERLDEALKVSFQRATTDGWIDREPSARPQGSGSFAAQRSEHRFLHFKTADDWLAYNREFGAGDPLKAIFQHINSMSREIAAREVLGPNPPATVEWLKQVVMTEAAKAKHGEESLFKANALPENINEKYLAWRIESLADYVMGRPVVSSRVAAGFGSARNLLTSAQLGSTAPLAAATDPWIDMAARRMAGLPALKALGGIVNALPGFAGPVRERAVRSGLIWDDFLHIMGDEARYAGTLGGSEWSRWLADRTVNLSGLEPITQARKHVFGLDFQAALADHSTSAFADMPRYLRRAMESYGLDERAWDKMRAVPHFTPDQGMSGWLRPADVANVDRDLAVRYLGMIYGETERAVPTGTARARSFVTGTAPRGTVFGEILESGLQYKSFGLSFTTLQIQAVQQELHQGPARGGAYVGGLLIGLTLSGGMAIQLRHLAQGKDTEPMDNAKFIIRAIQTGGGWGLAGDFLLADVNRFGHSLGEQLAGPTAGLATDLSKLTIGNIRQALEGKNPNLGREAVNLAGRYTPVASSLWYARAAYRRVILDQLQYLVDPDAHKNWRQQEQKTRRETKQGYWWRPGETSPDRAPEFNLTAP